MKIVDRKTFLAMPAGTLFAKYEPCNFDILEIKGESFHNDFMFQRLSGSIECNNGLEFADKLFDAQQTGASVAIDVNCQDRDGLFDDDQMFAVWEAKDVERLIERIQQAQSDAYTKMNSIVSLRVKASEMVARVEAAPVCTQCGDREFMVACVICPAVYCVMHDKDCRCITPISAPPHPVP